MIELILGGARSGKSRLAEQRAFDARLPVVYIATAEAGDAEMAQRIAHHRARRAPEWTVVEEPLRLAATLRQHAAPGRLLLVECLTLWLSNLLHRGRAAAQAEAGAVIACDLFDGEREALFATLASLPGEVILVSNEVGLGVVPLGAATRLFVDEAGRMNQRLAALADNVTFVAAGLPLALKSTPAYKPAEY